MYNNKLNRTKEAAKRNYFTAQFNLNSDNLKTTWKLSGMLINRKKSTTAPAITKLIYNGASYTDRKNIAHELNTHFIDNGNNLPEKLSPNDINLAKYIYHSSSNSFAFRRIYAHEVQDTFIGLNLNKSSRHRGSAKMY